MQQSGNSQAEPTAAAGRHESWQCHQTASSAGVEALQSLEEQGTSLASVSQATADSMDAAAITRINHTCH